jgi:oxalate decarboxylase/phosphoglucose isomerase-like protein (cupin superfamily)
MVGTGKAERIDPSSAVTHSFDWGMAKWFVTPSANSAALSFGEVVVMPGGGHSRHNHPDAEEVLYFISGQGEQMLDDGEPFTVNAGDVIYIPVGVYHSTFNTGWEPLRLIAIYNPGGSEEGLATLPDFKPVPAGENQGWTRS